MSWTLFIIIIWVITVIAAFLVGLFVYKNNSDKFKRLEKNANSLTASAKVELSKIGINL
jgi:septation ring formation regulator EzrA